jgi:Divergent InlB B-repeat domain
MRRVVLALSAAAALWLAPGAFAAWCGSGETATDRLPDIVTAQQIHSVVVVPSDAPDTFADNANQLADDVASMTSWWQGQDPTRIPRFDQAVFNATSCLDISFLRLPETTASYAGMGADAAFRQIGQDLISAGFDDPYKKYLVYFEGPSVQEDICGFGGGDLLSGPSYAIVVPAGCTDVPTDTIATHELLHALGAVPPGDPHCPADPAHPCDSPTDVLYPTTDGSPLSTKVLDYNHDDYYGHSQSWPDVQDSLWLHRLDEAPVLLGIAFSGGAGEISSELPGLDCTAACSTQWDPGAIVMFDAEPSGADRFVGWKGACTGRGTCLVTLAQSLSVTATFGPLRIPLHVSSAGKGKVTCSPVCTKTFTAGNALRLKAVASKGWKFAGWSGGCKGVRPTCAPATDYGLSVTARFKKR